METHDHDPTTGEPTDPWDDVTSEFGSLGDRLKETYRKVASDRGPSEEEIKGAFATLLGAWDQVAESVTAALQDPETRSHLKEAASSFASALGETMSGLGDEIKNTSAGWSTFTDRASDKTVEEGSAGNGVVDGDSEASPAVEDDL